MEEAERSLVNSMILSFDQLLPPTNCDDENVIFQQSIHLQRGWGADFIKEWLPGFPSEPVNRRSTATWGLARISGEWCDGGGTVTCSRLLWFWVYKGSQRLENHRCQQNSRPSQPLEKVAREISLLLYVWPVMPHKLAGPRGVTWEIPPLLYICWEWLSFRQVPSAKSLFHSLVGHQDPQKSPGLHGCSSIRLANKVFFCFLVFF